MAKPAGKTNWATGHELLLEGRVMDKHCNPVRDVRIELWHANHKGKYQYAGTDDVVTQDPTFTGAGRTYSKSDGSFSFRTLFPGAVGRRAPYLNIRISSPEMKGVFQTQLFFANDVRNDKDRVYRWVSEKRRKTITMPVRIAAEGGHISNISIVLPEKVGRLGY